MANEIFLAYGEAGKNLYALVFKANDPRQVWNVSAFENYATANRDAYDVPLTETPASSRQYYANFPTAIAAGKYAVLIYLRAGAAPAESDALKGIDPLLEWTGTAVDLVLVSTRAATGAAMALTDAAVDAVWNELRSGHTTLGTFGESFDGIEAGAAVAGTLSTTQMTTDLTEATTDHYKGRSIIWITGTLKRQASDVTSYDGATKKLVFSAVTEAPLVGDRFVLV